MPSPTVEANYFITVHKIMHNQPTLLLNSLILSSTPFPLVHSVPARLGFLIFQEQARHTSTLGLLHWPFPLFRASLVAQTVRRLPTMQETQVRSLGREDPLEKEMAAHSSTLAWKIPWTEERGRL